MTDGLHGLPVPALVDSDPKKNPFLANPQDPWHVDVRPSVLRDASLFATRVVWDMSPEEAERAKACIAFCEGIPTEDLQHELPLASPRRVRWHEIQHLRRALPWLPAVQL